MRSGDRRGRGRRCVAVAASVAVALLAAGCGGGGSHAEAAGKGGHGAPPPSAAAATLKPAGSAATVVVNVASGARDVPPDTALSVTAKGGTLSAVRVVSAGGHEVAGGQNVASTRWTAAEPLGLDAAVTVSATVVDRTGRATTVHTAFHTLAASDGRQLHADSIAPLAGSVVGIAQPIAVGFDSPVRDRAAVQKALQVEASQPVTGGWYWIDSRNVDYRPEAFWPAGTTVTLHANLDGVNAGNGYWGARSRTVSFTIGRAQVIQVNLKHLQMTVVRGGKTLRTFPVTSGKPGWETRNGTKVIMDKETNKTWTNEAIDAPEHYRLHSDWALRMTESGEFIHDAPWSTANFGQRSASHGCIGMYPDDASWVFRNTIEGDPVVITGSPRQYTDLTNRYADWNIPWKVWSRGNA